MKYMMPTTSSPDLELNAMRQQLEAWRSNAQHRQPIPEPIWKTATELASVLGISKVAQTLRLNYAALKRRVALAARPSSNPPAFIELACAPVSPQGMCRVFMEDSAGGKMSLEMATADAAVVRELALAFWRRSS